MRGGFRVQHCSHPVFDSDMLPRESPVSVGSVGLKGVVFVKCDRYHNDVMLKGNSQLSELVASLNRSLLC